ncbi:hypothetical protein [Streptomyces nodosus]|uniref:hypothetical protein n=1 Tax=Streptomyces nodosus TaxID=40318 RepID=UPI0018243D7C|nr:hypothetical protein [Streptomyces nodosus]MBB4795428.1 hypothetical protein [Streptomyces nodosus]
MVTERQQLHDQRDLCPLGYLPSQPREKQAEWRPEIVARLQKTTSSTDGASVIANVRVAAALEILWIVLGQWSASDGQEDLGKLLDAAFAAFSTPACHQTDAPL